jgi:lysine 2,3-aminomutase
MKEKLTPHLKELIGSLGISKQYVIDPSEISATYNDPLMEDSHEVVKGLIHKYKNRALIKVSYQCAAHCRFCTRIRQIGEPSGTLTEVDIENIISYLKNHPEIEDVILSGGDPFLTPKITGELLSKLSTIDSVKVIRIGTRLPLQSPKSFKSLLIKNLLREIKEISITKPFYVLIHVNHPDELTQESISAIKKIKQQSGTTLLSQTVFLNDVNIDFDTLYALFTKLYFSGVTPYYIYHCDSVKGIERYVGNIETEKEIMRKLRDALSGIAYPTYIADLENEYGKYPFDLEIIKTTNNKVYKR